MTNLIPPKAKRNVRVEYFVRVFAVFLFAAAIWFFILAILFTSIQVLVQLRIQGLETGLSNASKNAASIETAVIKINEANNKLKYLTLEDVEDRLLIYKKDLDEVTAGTIDISSYSMNRDEDKEVSAIDITAVAETRQDIITFLDLVQKNDRFGEVEVPISDLAKARDIKFSVAIPIMANDS